MGELTQREKDIEARKAVKDKLAVKNASLDMQREKLVRDFKALEKRYKNTSDPEQKKKLEAELASLKRQFKAIREAKERNARGQNYNQEKLDKLVELQTGEPVEKTPPKFVPPSPKKKKRRSGGSARKPSPAEIEENIIEDSILAHRFKMLSGIRDEEIRNGTKGYDSIAIIKTHDPGHCINLINSFEPDEIEPFLYLSPLEMSSLVPQITISKVIIDENKNTTELELPLQDYIPQNNFDNILRNREGRGGGVGIEFIELQSQGQQPALRSKFEAKIVLNFQDISELTKIRNTIVKRSGGGQAGTRDAYSVSFLDIIHKNTPTDAKGRQYDPVSRNYFDLDKEKRLMKLKIGWAGPKNTGDKNVDFKFTEYTNTVYNLQVFETSFDFQKNGSVKLEIKAYAYLEALANSKTKSDIMRIHDKIKSNISLRKTQINKKNNEIEKEREKLKKEKRKRARNRIHNKINKLQEEIESISLQEKINVKSEVLANFMNFLYSNEENDNEDRRLYYYNISPSEMQNLKNITTFSKESDLFNNSSIKESDQKLLDSIIKDRNKATIGAERTGLATLSSKSIKKLGNPSLYKSFGKNGKILENLTSTKAEASIKQNIKNKFEKKGVAGRIIPYFYLGDLINYFVKFYSHNEELDKNIPFQGATFLSSDRSTRVALTDITYSDYGNPGLLTSNNLVKRMVKKDYNTIVEGQEQISISPKQEITNIGSIPISLKSFVRWYNEKIVASKMESYTIFDFLKECVEDLISLNLTNKILPASKEMSVDIQLFQETMSEEASIGNNNIPNWFTRKTNSKNGIVVDFDYEDNPFKRIRSKISNFENSRPDAQTSSNSKNYIILHNKLEKAIHNGDYETDKKFNTFHFYIGEEKGIIKNISFKNIENPNLSAGLRLKQYNMGTNRGEVGLVPMKYEANIEMMGNNLFFPGNYLYIAPTLPGTNFEEPLLNEIGLSGYYNVLNVNLKIQSGLFTTSIKANWTNPVIDKELNKQLREELSSTDDPRIKALIKQSDQQAKDSGAKQQNKVPRKASNAAAGRPKNPDKLPTANDIKMDGGSLEKAVTGQIKKVFNNGKGK